MRIDSHQHFWKYNPAEYGWMAPSMERLRRDYLPAELIPQLQALGFDGTIAVQARRMVEETDWLLELADAYPFIRGVVGWVDFQSDNVEGELEWFSSRKRFCGVRELIHDMPDADYATSVDHIRGVSLLEKFDLTYDLLLKPPHIRPAIELVRQLPNQLFVVDHIAKPEIAAGDQTSWETDIRALASFDNVFCKLSGMVTEADWNHWRPADLEPYLNVVLEAFGPHRLMIGSDWPVCRLAGEYEDVMGVVAQYTSGLSTSEQKDILGDTCARFYNVTEDVARTSPPRVLEH